MSGCKMLPSTIPSGYLSARVQGGRSGANDLPSGADAGAEQHPCLSEGVC